MTDIFEYVEDIEETYSFLIKDAEKENQRDIEKFKQELEDQMGDMIKSKQEFLSLRTRVLSKIIEKKLNTFEMKTNKVLEDIQNEIEEQRNTIITSFLKKLGLDFE